MKTAWVDYTYDYPLHTSYVLYMFYIVIEYE